MNSIQTELLEQVADKKYGNIAGIVVWKDGCPVYESYFHGSTAADRLHVYSVTKSILSILIGIAADKGCIRSVSQKVLDFFPDYQVRKGEQAVQDITLEQLLTMTAPYRYRIPPYIRYFTSDDWVKFTLDQLGGRGKPGKFQYAPLIGPDILSGILIKATGQSVLDFAAEHLFSPLGITVARSVVFHSREEQLAFNRAKDISGWAADPAGTNAGGWGLTLSPVDMAKLGQLYLDGGRWDGKQIVSGKWVAESTREHSRWEKEQLPYGYLWWVHRDGFAAMGDGGNVIYVNTRKRFVAAVTSFFKPRVMDRIEMIQTYIEPLF